MDVLLLLAAWCWAAVALVGLGARLCRWLDFSPARASWLHWFWSGVAVWVALAQVAHLFVPVNGWLPLCLMPVALYEWRRGELWAGRPRLSGTAWGLAAAGAGATLGYMVLMSLQPCDATDTGLYFVQSTLWARDFAVVPGLGNLNPFLSTNHSYFLWVSSWSLGPFFERPWVIANGVLCLGVVLPAVLALAQLVTSPSAADPAWLLLVMVLAPLADIVNTQVASPVADVAVAATQGLLALWLATACVRRPSAAEATWMSGLAVLAATLKLAAAFAPLVVFVLCGWTLLRERARPTQALLWCGVPGVAWLVHGYVLSGYPIYPFPIGSLPVDWRVPHEIARAYQAVSSAQYHQGTWFDPSGTPMPDWPLHWLANHWLDNKTFVLPVAGLVLGALGLLAARLRRRALPAAERYLAWASAAVAIWFVAAPEVRFAQVFCWLAGFGSWAWLWPDDRVGRRSWAVGVLVLVAGMGWPPHRPIARWEASLPPPPVSPSLSPATLTTGERIWVGGSGCYLYPCAYSFHPQLRLRRPGQLASGFALEPDDRQFP